MVEFIVIFEPIQKLITLDNFILKIAVFTQVLPIIFYLVFKKRINDKSLRVIFFLLIFAFACDLYGYYSLSDQKGNFITYNLLILIEGLSLGFFFYQILNNKIVKQILFVTGLGFSIFWVFKFLTYGRQTFLNSCITIENVSILAFAVYYYYEQVRRVRSTLIYNQPRFWIVTAYLIYIAGTFFLLLYLPSFSMEDQEKYYVLNYVFLILRTILLCIAMLMKTDNPATKNSRLTVTSNLSNDLY